jgi:glycosyltransferase involved in cell wall biosynthesis
MTIRGDRHVGRDRGSELLIDLVMPVYNEADALPAVLASLSRQVDAFGTPLRRDRFRIIAVNNSSADCSLEILRCWAVEMGNPELVILEEPRKGHVLARATGSAFALTAPNRPLVVHADSDNLFPPTFIDDIARRFERGDIDVLSYLGFEPVEFWKRVPRLARRQLEEVGSISFCPETLRELGLDECKALITPRIFADFENVPTHCGLAMTKQVYRRTGGYIQEFNADGTERLGVARNFMFRLDRAGARLAHILSPSVVVNPRRYLLEAEDLWAGRSYTAGMTDLRQPIRDEHYVLLDQMSEKLDFGTARRNTVQRFIIDPCIARPERVLRNRVYFGSSADEVYRKIWSFLCRHDVRLYTDVRGFSDELVDEHYPVILSNLRALRGLEQG